MDNAPIHKSKIFMENIENWRVENDLFLFFFTTAANRQPILQNLTSLRFCGERLNTNG
jgi:hypothetical protein